MSNEMGISDKSFFEHHVFFCVNQRDGGRECCNQHDAEGVRAYYSHLERLGLTEEDLLAYALVLGREPEQAAR